MAKIKHAKIFRQWTISVPYNGNLSQVKTFAESRIFAIKTSRIVGNDNDTPIDNDATVLNEKSRG